MQKIELNATKRQLLGKKTKNLRKVGKIPAVLYGNVKETTPLTLDAKEFDKVFGESGTSALVDLKIDEDKAVKVLFHEPQFHHLSLKPIHVDLYAVKMSEKIETAIPIHFVGESPAVEELEGNLMTTKDELNIKCLPGDLISFIEVDLSVLKTFEDQVRIGDIKLPETIQLMDDPEEVLASVEKPISEEELEAELAEPTTSEAEAIEELAKEEPAEGEATEEKSE